MYERELIVLPRDRIARVGKPSFIIKLSECENPSQAMTVTEIPNVPCFKPDMTGRSLTCVSELVLTGPTALQKSLPTLHLIPYPLLLKDLESLPTRKRMRTKMHDQKDTAAKKTEDAKAKTRQRRAHTRSRAGCSECRSRRIRCGEQRPKW